MKPSRLPGPTADPVPTPTRWVGVGRSNLTDDRQAGRSAVIDALAGRSDPALLVVFASVQYQLDDLLDEINAASGDVPLIGCSTAGEIATDGPGDAGVVVFAIGGTGFSVATGLAEDASDDLHSAGLRAADAIGMIAPRTYRTMVILTDALAGDQSEILRGTYERLGASVPIVGGCAGDDLHMRATHQFFGRRVLTNAVVTAAIGSDGPFGIGVRHGWTTVGDPMVVTKSSGTIVEEIDGRPALDVYLERLKAPTSAYSDPAAFSEFALSHPLGLARRTGEPYARFVGEANFANRSLVCIASVPEGGATWIMRGTDTSVLDATDAACAEANAGLGGHQPLGVLAFDCIARRSVLGEAGIKNEIDRIALQVEGAPVAGFYTYGEIARTQGVTGFHNETLVILAIG